MTQYGEVSAVASPSPMGSELATAPEPGTGLWAPARLQAERGFRRSKRSGVASRTKVQLEEGRQDT